MRKYLVTSILLAALLTPASWAGLTGEEFNPYEDRLTEVEFKVLRLETKVQCLMADKYSRSEKCRARVILRP